MVYLFLAQQHETVEALTPIDVLRRADIPVTTVSVDANYEVTSSCGVTVRAEKLFAECDFRDATAIILPGGSGHTNFLKHDDLCALIRESYANGKLIAAICAAPKVLYANGIRVKSTIFPDMKDELGECYSDEKVCVSGNVITANAMAASLDFALEIVAYINGADVANAVADSIFY